MVRRIPRGKVATYGQIAELLGAPRAARIVGWAMHGNPHGSRVPCHRVVGSTGSLTGFAGGIEAKYWLLQHERAHSPSAGQQTLRT